ncbi:hypothetical protein MAR_029296 [Mya arenaria]|uniref:Uncharacterized protein n=1 Tax=Mya arenaria TaxID=6604 RepID=A0ABY7DJ22_MYAAR|nr:hypothetical protein MAR_029296 [Mya arenaria]
MVAGRMCPYFSGASEVAQSHRQVQQDTDKKLFLCPITPSRAAVTMPGLVPGGDVITNWYVAVLVVVSGMEPTVRWIRVVSRRVFTFGVFMLPET